MVASYNFLKHDKYSSENYLSAEKGRKLMTTDKKVNTSHLVAFNATRLVKVFEKKPRRHISRLRMDSSAACASCAMLTADESNRSASGMLRSRARTFTPQRLNSILSRPISTRLPLPTPQKLPSRGRIWTSPNKSFLRSYSPP